jgi:uncharacterized protein YprB with RNaseH-like and TPR domain
MSSLADRLRGVVGPPRGIAPLPPRGVAEAEAAIRENGAFRFHGEDGGIAGDVAEILGGSWTEAGGQRFLVIDRTYLPGHRHGEVAMADALPPTHGLWPRLSLLATPRERIERDALLFVDLETTGLAGGAGTYAFLVGCAWFDGGTFRVRQFFLSDFGGERSLLDALRGTAELAGAVVTYNGKTFDLPLIETRYAMHRMPTPFSAVPHIDMLHPARRLWRAGEEGGSCRLSALEQSLCGHVREGDVPGFEIPARYFHFVRTGDPRPLLGVLEHNRLDLLSLALLTSQAAQLLERGPGAARTAREACGLGRLYERAGMMTDARECFEAAAALPGDSGTHAEALRAYAVLSRRARRYDDAAVAWQRILVMRNCPAAIVREATDALAVHHEHRRRDPGTARAFALQALRFHGGPARRQAIEHRLARLDRKMGEPAPAVRPLF